MATEHRCRWVIGSPSGPSDAPAWLHGVALWLVAEHKFDSETEGGIDAARPRSDSLARITDALHGPMVDEGVSLQIGSCRINGKDNMHGLVVARHDGPGSGWGDASWLRRLETTTGKRVELEPGWVDCHPLDVSNTGH